MIALVSTHGGNNGPLRPAAERLNEALPGVVVCAPDGDVGRDPWSHSGERLTSVMLALQPEAVQLRAADADIAAELDAPNADRGAIYVERFVRAIVDGVRAAADSVDAPR